MPTSKKCLLGAGVCPLCGQDRDLLGQLEPQVSEGVLAVGLSVGSRSTPFSEENAAVERRPGHAREDGSWYLGAGLLGILPVLLLVLLVQLCHPGRSRGPGSCSGPERVLSTAADTCAGATLTCVCRCRARHWRTGVAAVDPGRVLQVGHTRFGAVHVRLIAGEPVREVQGGRRRSPRRPASRVWSRGSGRPPRKRGPGGGRRRRPESWTEQRRHGYVSPETAHADGRGCVQRPRRKADVWVTGMEPSRGMQSSSSVVMDARSGWGELSGRLRKSSSLSLRCSLSTAGRGETSGLCASEPRRGPATYRLCS